VIGQDVRAFQAIDTGVRLVLELFEEKKKKKTPNKKETNKKQNREKKHKKKERKKRKQTTKRRKSTGFGAGPQQAPSAMQLAAASPEQPKLFPAPLKTVPGRATTTPALPLLRTRSPA